MSLGSLIDRCIAPFAPERAMTRTISRKRLEFLSTYAAADKGRRNKDWKANPGSADLAIIPDNRVINARARQLVRDSWVAKSAIKAFSRNVVGRGISPAPVAKDAAGKDFEKFNRRAEDGFFRWASDAKNCDLERRQTLWQKQSLCSEERATVGEHVLVLSYVPGDPGMGLKFQSVESEQFYEDIQSYTDPATGITNQVRGGVEIDANNAPVAYHFWSRNPNDYLLRPTYFPVRVLAERVLHYYRQERSMQTRGVSPLAPVMQDIRDLTRFKEAHLWAAIMEACVGGVVTKEIPSSTTGGATTPSFPPDPNDPGSGTTPSGLRTMDFVPGMFAELAPGEDIKFLQPQRPGGTYDPFTKQILRGISAGFGTSYEQVARDFTAGSYSSQRQSMLEDFREWRPEQDLLTEKIIAELYQRWLTIAITEGFFDDILGVDGFSLIGQLSEAEYLPDGHDWIDPWKEVKGYEAAIALRIQTRKEIIGLRGGRLRRTFDQISAEQKLAGTLGITLPEDVDAAQGGLLAGNGATAIAGINQPNPGGSPAPAPAAKPKPAPAAAADPDEGPEDDTEGTFDPGPASPSAAMPPIGKSSGRVIGAPFNSFGPHDNFDSIEHGGTGDQ